MEGRSYVVEYATQRNKWMDSGEEKKKKREGEAICIHMRKSWEAGDHVIST
jgi:hypothetical protein